MIRLFFEYLLPLVTPFLVYFGWVWVAARHAEKTGGQAPDWRQGPWLWLGSAGLALLMALLVAGALTGGHPAGGIYHPPMLGPDGKIVPGHVERPQ